MRIQEDHTVRDMTPEEIEAAEPTNTEDVTEEDYVQVLDDLGVRLS